MNTQLQGVLPLLLGLCLIASFAQADDELHVLASIKPVHSILAGLMQGVRPPGLVVRDDSLPYDYQLSEAQKKQLQQADLVVWVGPELEAFMAEASTRAKPGSRWLELLSSPDVKILPSRWNDEQRDPYFWLDSRNALMLLDLLTKELMAADPGRTHLYRRNRDRLFEKIAELDRRLEYGYRGLKGGVALAYYDTQQYFEQAYALKVGGVLTSSPQQPVAAARLLQERLKLVAGEYACLLTERGLPMPEASLLLKDVNIQQAELDSLGTGFEPGEDLYLDLMNHNTGVIKRCMRLVGVELESAGQQSQAPTDPMAIGGKFMLIDQNGRMVTEKDMLGKYQLIYFGYTYCPDVCPTSLQVMMAALKRLGDKADRVQPYFISVDPQRDTRQVMAGYVRYFGDRLIGLTGSQAMIDRVIREFRLTVEKVLEPGMSPENYLLDHTASLYLMGPDGRFITKFAHGTPASQIARRLDEIIAP